VQAITLLQVARIPFSPASDSSEGTNQSTESMEIPDYEPDEQSITENLKKRLSLLQNGGSREVQHRIHHELAAKHLPALMTAYRALSTPTNAPMVLMNVISYTPYFVRFIVLPENTDLSLLLLQRIANSEIVSSDMQETIAELCQFVATVLMLQSRNGLSKEDLNAVINKLRHWARAYRDTFAEDASLRALMLLAPNGTNQEKAMLANVSMQLNKGVNNCAVCLEGRSSKQELLQCSRCKTVRYCGVQHQKVDWSSHKKMCIAPSF